MQSADARRGDVDVFISLWNQSRQKEKEVKEERRRRVRG